MQKVINFWGVPGSGKSTIAARVYGLLKQHGHSAELVGEYAKELAWKGELSTARSWNITLEQISRQKAMLGKAEFLICDSPLLMALAYFDGTEPDNAVEDVNEEWSQSINYNFFVLPRKDYNPHGRQQTKKEALALLPHIKQIATLANLNKALVVVTPRQSDGLLLTSILVGVSRRALPMYEDIYPSNLNGG